MWVILNDKFAHPDLACFASFENANRIDLAVLRGV